MTRWRPARAGIFNIWEYDDQVFEFGDGRLVLRGRNGSGKSNALALLFPFLFDGVMSPTRMDPMGGGRSMRSLLLGRDDDGDGRRYRHDSGQGYVWMEFCRDTDDRDNESDSDGGETDYVTIGIGAKATQHRDAQAWFFVTPLRVGGELHLAHDDVPLGRRELSERLGDRGRIFDTAEEYRRAVDSTLFGLGAGRMRTVLDLLLTLRRPHLAGKLDTDHLSFALSSGLAELDSTLIADLARSFDDLDAMEDELAGVRGALDAVERFLPSYRLHLLGVARARSNRLLAVDQLRRDTERELRHTERDLIAATEAAAHLDLQLGANRHHQRDLETEIETILASPAYRSAAALAEAERVASTARSAANAAAHERDAATERHARDIERAERAAAELQVRELELGDALAGWSTIATSTGIADAPGDADDFDPAAATAAITRRLAAVEEIETLAESSTAAAAAARQAATTLDAANAERHAAEEAVGGAEERVEVSQADYDAALASWSTEIDAAIAVTPAAFTDPPPTATVWEHRDDLDARERELERHVGELRRVAQLATERAARRRDDDQAALDELVIERATVADDPNPGPPADPTRPDSGASGVPLYVCTDFAASVDPADRAGLEAALEAAGLLDATVGGDPSGDALDAGIAGTSPLSAGSPTLADILVAVPAGAVDATTIDTALRAIALDDSVVHLAADGSWRLGPLAGRYRKSHAEYIGHEARERRRADRLAALDDAITDATVAVEHAAAAAQRAHRVEQAFTDLAEARPSSAALRRARADQARAVALAEQRTADHDRAAAAAAESDARADAASSELHRRATALALPVDAPDLRVVRDGLVEARQHRDAIVRCRERLSSQRLAAGEATTDARAAEAASVAAAERAAEAARAADREEHRFERLRADVGAEARDAQERAQRARQTLDTARADNERLQGELADARAATGQLTERRTSLSERSDALVGDLAAAEAAMAVVVSAEISEVLALDGVDETAELHAAGRAVVADPTDVPDDATNDMERKYRQLLLDGLRAGHDPAMPKLDGIDLVRVGTADGDVPLGTLARRLREEHDRLETLLTDREREIFETHLLARVADAVRSRLAEGDHFERTINAEMAKAPTSSGMTVELGWVIDTDDRAARDAVKALRFEPEVMSPEQRESLRAFFNGQIAAQRAADPGASYVEVLSAALDYRSWHTFRLYVRAAGGGRTEVTRQYFRGLSGGEAATVLHLPLFASAAAHYGAGSVDGPRLIALDEAFAGIDDEMRARLMGLLVQLDLDVLLTSHEFWGFYEQVPELVVYDLVRRPPTPGVFAQRLDWASA